MTAPYTQADEQADIEQGERFARSALDLDARIASKLTLISSLRENAERVTRATDGLAVHTGEHRSPQDALDSAMDISQEVLRDYQTLLALKKRIYALISRVPDARMRLALELRYLSMKPQAKIAEALNVSMNTSCSILRKGLRALGALLRDGAE